jgi:hypothetical protein
MAHTKIIPLRDVPFEISVDGVTLKGRILWLYPNDIEVEILEPFNGLRTGVHVPYFAMYPVNRLATTVAGHTTALTTRGRERAEQLLRDLYQHACGNRGGWPVEELTPARWKRTTNTD